ncbi:MAG TPA: hypothetical protein VGO78_06020, partial [Acidimicrobiales bacterium]|nr:hypothetical protein [Acidimicrobiales bacterium]
MTESDLWDLLPPARPLPSRCRREIREALMAQIHHDLAPDIDRDAAGAGDSTGAVPVDLVPAGAGR